MIILPNALPVPRNINVDKNVLPTELLIARAALSTSPDDNSNDVIRYLVRLEEYVEELCAYVKTQTGAEHMGDASSFIAQQSIYKSGELPWENLRYEQPSLELKQALRNPTLSRRDKSPIEWSLAHEIEICVIVISLIYMKLGSELINELIELTPDTHSSRDSDEKWKQVTNYFKKSISFNLFGAGIGSSRADVNVNEKLFVFLHKISDISIQMSIIAKSSWLNRNSFNATETFESTNNGMLSRVAIYVLHELETCTNLLVNLESDVTHSINLNYNKWADYLGIIKKYVTAYAGLFLSIECYQKDRLGQAIGLTNFSLLTLQSKRVSADKTKEGKGFTKFRSKLGSLKNDQYISKLKSVTTMDVDKSVFQETSGIILKDLAYLFDQLVLLHLKLTKENDNLKFDSVVDWQDINKDSKWPLGCKIPVSDIKQYEPVVFQKTPVGSLKENYTGRGSYY